VVHVLGHLQRLERCDAHQNEHLVQDVPPGQLVEPHFEAVGVVDQVGLEELRPGVDLLVLAQGLEFGPRGERRCRRAQEHLGRELDRTPVEVVALVAHPAQHPQHLHRIQINDVQPSQRRRPHAPAVAGEHQHVAHAQGARPQHLRLQRGPRAVAALHLHDRLGPVLQGDSAAGQAGHARRGRGVVGEVDGGYVRLHQVNVLAELARRRAQRGRNFRRDDELPGAQPPL